MAALQNAVIEEWEAIPQTDIQYLIARMRRRLQEWREAGLRVVQLRRSPTTTNAVAGYELLPFVFNGVIVTGGEKKWGWRGPSCQLEIARGLSGMFGIYRYCSALPPLFLSACHDHPVENKREELVLPAPIHQS
ncbi:hypothetical protein J6590_043482 [Homalodisca vitripennis]|nr:hypothetical protein J6590_043482 [Homalodisca vitripennis]